MKKTKEKWKIRKLNKKDIKINEYKMKWKQKNKNKNMFIFKKNNERNKKWN